MLDKIRLGAEFTVKKENDSLKLQTTTPYISGGKPACCLIRPIIRTADKMP